MWPIVQLLYTLQTLVHVLSFLDNPNNFQTLNLLVHNQRWWSDTFSCVYLTRNANGGMQSFHRLIWAGHPMGLICCLNGAQTPLTWQKSCFDCVRYATKPSSGFQSQHWPIDQFMAHSIWFRSLYTDVIVCSVLKSGSNSHQLIITLLRMTIFTDYACSACTATVCVSHQQPCVVIVQTHNNVVSLF